MSKAGDRTAYTVTLSDVSAGYGGEPKIRRITLTLQPGRITVLIGPNGAGKSTILRTIAGELPASAGAVLIGGDPVASIPGRELARRVSVTTTERPDTGYMTCFDVAAAGRYPYTGAFGRLSAEDREKVAEALRTVRAEEISGRLFMEVSDGQKQNVLLARAICQETPVMLLDEPASYLDIRSKLSLLGALSAHARRYGTCVVLSMHETDLAERIADFAVCVKDGEILSSGVPAEIFRQEIIEPLYGLPEGSYDPLSGTCEFRGAEGEPELFLISSGGRGVPVMRELQRRGIPFAAGVLFENDADLPYAKRLAAKVFTAAPFRDIPEETAAAALGAMEACGRVITTEDPENAPVQAQVASLIRAAEERGILKSMEELW